GDDAAMRVACAGRLVGPAARVEQDLEAAELGAVDHAPRVAAGRPSGGAAARAEIAAARCRVVAAVGDAAGVVGEEEVLRVADVHARRALHLFDGGGGA